MVPVNGQRAVSRNRAAEAHRRVLLACALAPEDVDLTSALAVECRAPSFWTELEGVATANQIRPQLAMRLRDLPATSPCICSAQALYESVGAASRGRGLMMAGELIAVSEALAAAGITAVPFKGPAFATLVGQGPGLREMTDLDILVEPRNIFHAASTLARLGYEPPLQHRALRSRWLVEATSELPLLRSADSMLIELHWRLAPPWFPSSCAIEDVIGRLAPRDFFGAPIAWPAPEELFLIHVADGMKSGGRGVRWIEDVAHILRRHELDWGRVRAIARRSGGLNTVRIALAVIEDVSGEVSSLLHVPGLAIQLPANARDLAREARASPTMSAGIQAVVAGLGTDTPMSGSIEHFRWSVRVSDRPARTIALITRYLLGPAFADLDGTIEEGDVGPALRLRLRAVRRRWRDLCRRGPR